MDGIRQLIENAKARIAQLSFNQKVLLGAVTTASVISVAVFSLWLQKEDKSVLFTNLTPEDASAALAELAKQDIPTELTNGGTTILVPENVVYKMRVDLAAKGVPSSGTVGFEIFDGKQYGLTEFTQQVNLRRALEGELTKTIEGMPGIQSARVHLVLPKPSIYKRFESAATSSVVLRLGLGANLSDGQITGIQNLVAGGVEGLTAENVSVLDQNSQMLSSAMKDDMAGRTENQLAMRKGVEDHLSEKATSMLDRVLGPGKSIVRVDATLNFEKIEKEREYFDPNAVILSEERTETNNAQTGDTNEQSTTNYEVNKTVEHIVSDVGGVTTLSVAVFVDGHYEASEDGGAPIYTPLSEDELGNLRRIVQRAVGLNAVRGDQIEVVPWQFNNNDLGLSAPGMAPDWLGIGTQYGGKVILVIMLLVLALTLKKNIGKLLVDATTPASARAAQEAAEAPEDREHFDGIPDFNDSIVDDIQEYAAENPERVAEVIQSWIHDISLGPKVNEAAGD